MRGRIDKKQQAPVNGSLTGVRGSSIENVCGKLEPGVGFYRPIVESCHCEDTAMSRPTGKTLIASVSILSLAMLVLTPSSAFACCRGFGIGFGIGALTGMAVTSQPQPAPAPVYVERRPVPVTSAPVVRSAKTTDTDKRAEKHHHKETHVADKEPVTRTMRHEHEPHQPPVATNTKPSNDSKSTNDSKDADLRKCLVKEYLPDNSVVFKDTCTQEQASTAKPAPATNEPRKITQSIQLEPPAVAQDEVPQPQQMDGP
jgi:hypothetical protein